jgi:protein gp37
MPGKTKIEWTEVTWNPVTGCSKISEGCKNCYAERMALRLKAMGQENYRNGFNLTCHKHMVDKPLSWSGRKTVFVNSMSDLFHQDVPSEFIRDVFKTMNSASQHIFQVLTKRPERIADVAKMLKWTENIWMGVTVENGKYINRIDSLRTVGAQTKFLSIEPMIGPIDNLDLNSIDWVIVGGESGPGARPIEKVWVEGVHQECKKQKVPFFFKQWGGVNKKKNGRLLYGKTWDETPKSQLAA